MAKLEGKIKEDLNEAQKQKDEDRISALRLLRAALEEKFIQGEREDLKDEDVMQIIKKEAKKIKDSIEAFKKGKREDLVKKEQIALKVLKDYLPPEASDEEVRKYIKETIDEMKPEGKKDFGRVMSEVMGKLKGRANGKLVSQVVNEELSKLEEKKEKED